MSAAQKRKRPEAAATAKGPDIKLIHSERTTDMNSVAQSQKPPTLLDDVAMELHDVMLIAKRGGVLCDALMTEDAQAELDTEKMQLAIWDLSEKFERIAADLDRIHGI